MPAFGGIKTCPYCGVEMSGANIGRHIAARHAEEAQPEQEWSTDEPPKASKRAGAKKKASGARRAPSRGPAPIPLAKQLELPYLLLGNVASARGLQITGGVLAQQAPVCAQAWDQFLMRYPALREKIEQGMIAGDVVALIMAHVPIVQAAREEIAARARAMEGYDGGISQQPAAA